MNNNDHYKEQSCIIFSPDHECFSFGAQKGLTKHFTPSNVRLILTEAIVIR